MRPRATAAPARGIASSVRLGTLSVAALYLSGLCVAAGEAQSYEVLARYDFDEPEDMEEWELAGVGAADAMASWDAALGSPEAGSARFEVGGFPFGKAFRALGPCLPPIPLGEGYTVRLVGQRRTEQLNAPGNVWGQCEIGLSAYDEEPVCEGWPDAWTVFPPDGANPWFPGAFLPYLYDVPQTETRFLGQRVHLSVGGRMGVECWFDSVEVQLIPPPVTIPTLSPGALALLCTALAAIGVWVLRR